MFVHPSYQYLFSGLVLSNPSGYSGIHNLHIKKSTRDTYQYNQIVTIKPSGGDYNSLATAISSATQDTLFLIYPGSYGPYGHIYFDKNIKYHIKRVGGTQPSDVLVTLTDYFQQTNGNVIIEGCKFYRNGYEIYHAASGTYHINKCVLDSRFCFGHGSATWNTLTAVGTVSYTDMYSRYGAWFAHVAYVYYPTTSLIKVAHGGDYNYWRTYNEYARSHFAVEDYAPIGTSGYGSEYGNDVLEAEVVELTLGNGETQIVTVDSTVTLTDNDGNSIDVFVSVSDVSIVDQDYEINFSKDYYWVGGSSPYFNDPYNWSFETQGESGIGVPSYIDNAIIDENSFSEKGKFISFKNLVEPE